MTGDGRPFAFTETPAAESASAFSPDGRFYLGLDGRLVAARRRSPRAGSSLGASAPCSSFKETRKPKLWRGSPYTAVADGRRFLVNVLLGEKEHQPIVLQTGGAR
jgi:hypothetical protein